MVLYDSRLTGTIAVVLEAESAGPLSAWNLFRLLYSWEIRD